jgi:ABC-2 type transport system ATP-binding protein
VSVSVEPGIERLMSAVQSVKTAGVDIEDVALRRPKLDEVFLTLTGAHAGPRTDRAEDEGAA